MKKVKEGSKSYVNVRFKNEAGQVYLPTTIYYRIDCETTGRVILDDTPYTPVASSIRILVTPTQNDILADYNKQELKKMTVFADYGTDDQVTQTANWYVVNLRGV